MAFRRRTRGIDRSVCATEITGSGITASLSLCVMDSMARGDLIETAPCRFICDGNDLVLHFLIDTAHCSCGLQKTVKNRMNL